MKLGDLWIVSVNDSSIDENDECFTSESLAKNEAHRRNALRMAGRDDWLAHRLVDVIEAYTDERVYNAGIDW